MPAYECAECKDSGSIRLEDGYGGFAANYCWCHYGKRLRAEERQEIGGLEARDVEARAYADDMMAKSTDPEGDLRRVDLWDKYVGE